MHHDERNAFDVVLVGLDCTTVEAQRNSMKLQHTPCLYTILMGFILCNCDTGAAGASRLWGIFPGSIVSEAFSSSANASANDSAKRKRLEIYPCRGQLHTYKEGIECLLEN